MLLFKKQQKDTDFLVTPKLLFSNPNKNTDKKDYKPGMKHSVNITKTQPNLIIINLLRPLLLFSRCEKCPRQPNFRIYGSKRNLRSLLDIRV